MNVDTSQHVHFDFELFIAGDAPNSAQALVNLRSLCERRIPDRYTIAVVDVFRDPGRALEERIFLTPTVVRIAPGPRRRVVGTLSQAGSAADALGLDSEAA